MDSEEAKELQRQLSLLEQRLAAHESLSHSSVAHISVSLSEVGQNCYLEVALLDFDGTDVSRHTIELGSVIENTAMRKIEPILSLATVDVICPKTGEPASVLGNAAIAQIVDMYRAEYSTSEHLKNVSVNMVKVARALKKERKKERNIR